MKPFLANKVVPKGQGVVLETDGKIEYDKTSVAETSIDYFINIVEKQHGKSNRTYRAVVPVKSKIASCLKHHTSRNTDEHK